MLGILGEDEAFLFECECGMKGIRLSPMAELARTLDVNLLISKLFNNLVLDVLVRVELGALKALRRERRFFNILDLLPHRLILNLRLTFLS